jgi:hypothetical protein
MAKQQQRAHATASEQAVTRFQAFRVTRIHRSQILNAPYNPRTIDDGARAKLQDNLKRVGLVAPSTWNSRTGNLVGGHQRQACLDALEGTSDYYVDVAAVDMDDAAERQQNVFLNNASAQGSWDAALLAELLKDDSLDLSATGFDPLELNLMLEDAGVGMFSDDAGLDAIEDLKRIGAEKSKKRHAIQGDALPSDRVKGELNVAAKLGAEDTETYAVVVFTTRAEREIFVSAMGLDKDARYVDGGVMFRRIGVDPKEAWAKEFGGEA